MGLADAQTGRFGLNLELGSISRKQGPGIPLELLDQILYNGILK